jgi:hypothetical protein
MHASLYGPAICYQRCDCHLEMVEVSSAVTNVGK